MNSLKLQRLNTATELSQGASLSIDQNAALDFDNIAQIERALWREEQLKNIFDYADSHVTFEVIKGHEVSLRTSLAGENRYRILEALGEGADGQVLLVSQVAPAESEGKQFALKLSPSFLQEDLSPLPENYSEEDYDAALRGRRSLREIHSLHTIAKTADYPEFSAANGFELTPMIDARILKHPEDPDLRMAAVLMPYVESATTLKNYVLEVVSGERGELDLIQTTIGIAYGLEYLAGLGIYQADPIGTGNILLKEQSEHSSLVPVLIDMQRAFFPELEAEQGNSGFAHPPTGKSDKPLSEAANERIMVRAFAKGMQRIIKEASEIQELDSDTRYRSSQVLVSLEYVLSQAIEQKSGLDDLMDDLERIETLMVEGKI